MEDDEAGAMMKEMKYKGCRLCSEVFSTYNQLKRHFQTQHPRRFQEVVQWIDETTASRLRSAEEIAAEGMLGLVDPTGNSKSNTGNR